MTFFNWVRSTAKAWTAAIGEIAVELLTRMYWLGEDVDILDPSMWARAAIMAYIVWQVPNLRRER